MRCLYGYQAELCRNVIFRNNDNAMNFPLHVLVNSRKYYQIEKCLFVRTCFHFHGGSVWSVTVKSNRDQGSILRSRITTRNNL